MTRALATVDTGFVFQRDGQVLSARGEWTEVAGGRDQLARAAEAASVTAASHGLALVALPFDHAESGWLLAASNAAPVDLPVPESAARAPMRIHAVPGADGYERAVGEALRRINKGTLRKVVLARSLEVEAERELEAPPILSRLRAADPRSHLFSVPLPGGGTFVGASPELLVRRRGDTVFANPLAGSAARSGHPSQDAGAARRLLASGKDHREHAMVVEAMTEALAPVCRSLRVDEQPSLTRTATVWHLSTEIHGRLRDPAPSAADLAALLHPTPAVCGTPADAALACIRELEPRERGLYAGLIGWMDANGDGEWTVALRCAVLDGNRARLFAGAGVVAGSTPSGERAETDAKFRTLLRALGQIAES